MARRVTGLNAVEPTIMAGPSAFEAIINTWRTRTFVSCWTAQQQESHALWRIYCGAADGVAIQTTLGRLKQSTSGIPVERIIYRDPEARPINENIALTELAVEKRPMFAYEHEVRIIFKAPGPSPDRGHLLGWDPETALENVYVHPEADASFMATVQAIIAQIRARVNGSRAMVGNASEAALLSERPRIGGRRQLDTRLHERIDNRRHSAPKSTRPKPKMLEPTRSDQSLLATIRNVTGKMSLRPRRRGWSLELFQKNAHKGKRAGRNRLSAKSTRMPINQDLIEVAGRQGISPNQRIAHCPHAHSTGARQQDRTGTR